MGGGTIAGMRSALAPWRLLPQGLAGPPLASPAAVVGHLGAVQSQLHDMSLWALGRRCGATLAEVSSAFEAGDFVRTHALRPTWHHVLPADLTDLLAIAAPRTRQATASNARRDGLTPESLARWSSLAIAAVEADGPLTRPEIEARLADAGYVREGNGMAHVMIEAELTGAIHSGPMRGKQHTYIASSLPPSRRTDDERLAWVARRYALGHGPVLAQDLAWWTGLSLTQARRAIGLAELEPVDLDGETFHIAEPAERVDVPAALLLPAFDEFISYTRRPVDLEGVGGEVGTLLRSTGLLFVDGGLAGSWTRSVGAASATVTVQAGGALDARVRRALETEAAAYARFVERPVDLVVA